MEQRTKARPYLGLSMRLSNASRVALAILIGGAMSIGGSEAQQSSDWLAYALNGQPSTTPLGHIASLNILDPTAPSGQKVQLVWTVIPRNAFSLQAQLVNKIGPADKLYKVVTPANAVLTINGGFYQFNESHANTPLGLVLVNGQQKNPAARWSKGGGYVVATAGPGADISFTTPSANVMQSIQARPIIMQAGKNMVSPSGSKSPYNRMAIGTTKSGDLFIAGAFNDNVQAISLSDFSHFLSLLGSMKHIALKDVLNLDGSSDAHLFVPGTALHLGYHGTNYVPDVISILPR